ncbi:McrB family protein [Chakrabartyella piscis]|uniref:McrB family protein n=1 Tax=Chakrabartyella piscis TaxID=2918914 RepID=UPI002958B6F6|nr:AAA family ATPase [Chakrabartyella piscis]
MAKIGDMTIKDFANWIIKTHGLRNSLQKQGITIGAFDALVYIVSKLLDPAVGEFLYSSYVIHSGYGSSTISSNFIIAIGGTERDDNQGSPKRRLQTLQISEAISKLTKKDQADQIKNIFADTFINELYKNLSVTIPDSTKTRFKNNLLRIFDLEVLDSYISQSTNDFCPTPEQLTVLLQQNKQIILKGPPGTGKTRLAKLVAEEIISNTPSAMGSPSSDQIQLIQFHPSYAYEDFIMGLEVGADYQGNIRYEMKSRGLKAFADKASEPQNKHLNFVLIIDEINRAQVSSVFGELMYALEYRGQSITLSAKETMTIPDNLYIIGTMNTADRSIAELDYAMQRRFAFQYIPPTKPEDKELPLGKVFLVNLYNKVQGIFKKENVMAGIDPDDIRIGTSYFICNADSNVLKNPDVKHFGYKINYELIPLLTEYYKDGMFRKKQAMFAGDTKTFQDYLQGDKSELKRKLEGLK